MLLSLPTAQPWVAIPFGDARLKAINLHFEIEGIPSLIVLDKDFKVSISLEMTGDDTHHEYTMEEGFIFTQHVYMHINRWSMQMPSK